MPLVRWRIQLKSKKMKMTINLRKVLFFLLTLCLIGSAYAQDTALKEAEVAYTKEDYAKAIELYEGILKSNGESAAVYYNLGRRSIRLSRLVIFSWSNGLRAWRTSVPQTLGRRQVSCASCCLSVA